MPFQVISAVHDFIVTKFRVLDKKSLSLVVMSPEGIHFQVVFHELLSLKIREIYSINIILDASFYTLDKMFLNCNEELDYYFHILDLERDRIKSLINEGEIDPRRTGLLIVTPTLGCELIALCSPPAVDSNDYLRRLDKMDIVKSEEYLRLDACAWEIVGLDFGDSQDPRERKDIKVFMENKNGSEYIVDLCDTELISFESFGLSNTVLRLYFDQLNLNNIRNYERFFGGSLPHYEALFRSGAFLPDSRGVLGIDTPDGLFQVFCKSTKQILVAVGKEGQ